MIGGFGSSRLAQQYQDGKAAPSREVTRDEFIAAAITAGWTSEDADRHARKESGRCKVSRYCYCVYDGCNLCAA